MAPKNFERVAALAGIGGLIVLGFWAFFEYVYDPLALMY